MKTYLIQITMPDGSCGRCYGLYSDGFVAIVEAITNFPSAMRISARRLP